MVLSDGKREVSVAELGGLLESQPLDDKKCAFIKNGKIHFDPCNTPKRFICEYRGR